jgi:bifunctional non-homologous end joining protein LigD
MATVMGIFPKIEPVTVRDETPGIKRHLDDLLWNKELKFDGFRCMLYATQSRQRLLSRKNLDLSGFTDLGEQVAKAFGKKSIVLDGEIVSLDHEMRPDFDQLLRREGDIRFVPFDLLWLEGKDLRACSLMERLDELRKIRPESPAVPECVSAVVHGSKLWELVLANKLEGLVLKRFADPYGRGARWYKLINPAYKPIIKARAKIFNRNKGKRKSGR